MKKGPKGRKGRKVDGKKVLKAGDLVEIVKVRDWGQQDERFTAQVINMEGDMVRCLYINKNGKEVVTIKTRSEVGLVKDEIPW